MKRFALVFVTALLAQPAWALIELRAGYGLNMGSATNISDAYNSLCAGGCGANLSGANGLAADLLISLPVLPFGFGLRYESLQSKSAVSQLSSNMNFSYQRLAALVNYRIIDTLMYLGPIASLGISDSASYTHSQSGTDTKLTAGSNSSYSIGLEGGLKLLTFTVGAEVGYAALTSTNLRTSSNTTATIGGSAIDNASIKGSYAKVMVGFGF